MKKNQSKVKMIYKPTNEIVEIYNACQEHP